MRVLSRLVVALSAACLLQGVARAETPQSLLETMLTNMGYEIKIDGANHYFVDAGYYVGVSTSDDGMFAYFKIAYGLTPEQEAKIPWKDLLYYNATNLDSSYIGSKQGDHYGIVGLQCNLPIAKISPSALRLEISDLTYAATANQKLINPSNWK